MRTRTMVMVIALGAIAAAGAFAEEELRGRDVARDGRLATVSGVLRYDGSEWFLAANDGSFELHLGPFGHDESLPFTEGAEVIVRGFVLGEHIAPLWVTAGDETYDFWHEMRYPRWAGSGARMSAVDEEERAEYGARRFEPMFRNRIAAPGRGRW